MVNVILRHRTFPLLKYHQLVIRSLVHITQFNPIRRQGNRHQSHFVNCPAEMQSAATKTPDGYVTAGIASVGRNVVNIKSTGAIGTYAVNEQIRA